MTLATSSPKRIPTKPRDNRKIEEIEDDITKMKEDIDECKDIQGKMSVLDERTQSLVKSAQSNHDAIYGKDDSPGLLTRLAGLEIKMNQVMGFMGDAKKLGYGILIAALGIFLELLIQLILSHGIVLAK